MNLKAIFLALVFVVIFAWGDEVPKSLTREQRELEMADGSIAASLAVSRSAKGRYLCAENRAVCLGGDKAELGLALIGARSTKASLAALAAVVRFRTDASFSEDYECYVLQKGKSIDRYFAESKPSALEKQCDSAVEKLIGVDKKWFEGLESSVVCADEASIKVKIASLREAIRAGRKCTVEDF